MEYRETLKMLNGRTLLPSELAHFIDNCFASLSVSFVRPRVIIRCTYVGKMNGGKNSASGGPYHSLRNKNNTVPTGIKAFSKCPRSGFGEIKEIR